MWKNIYEYCNVKKTLIYCKSVTKCKRNTLFFLEKKHSFLYEASSCFFLLDTISSVVKCLFLRYKKNMYYRSSVSAQCAGPLISTGQHSTITQVI